MTNRPTKEVMFQRLMGADRTQLTGELAFILARSKFPLDLAMQILGCSRGSFYAWFRGVKPIKLYKPKIRRLIDGLEVALYDRQLPATSPVLAMQALLYAQRRIKYEPGYLPCVLNARDSAHPVHYNSSTTSAHPAVVSLAEIPNECDRIPAENMAPER